MVATSYQSPSGDLGYRVQTLDPTGRSIRSRVHVPFQGAGSLGIGGFVRLADGAVRTCVDLSQSQGYLAGLDAVGQPDASIGPNGIREIGGACALSPWGTSQALARGGGTLRRLYRDGRPVAGWGSNGVVEASTDPFVEPVVGPDGRLIDGATAVDTSLRRVVRLMTFLPDGRPDPSFGQGGTLTLHLGDVARTSRLVALDVDRAGRIVVFSSSRLQNGSTRREIDRLTPTGAFDYAFGIGGRIQMSSMGISLGVDGSDRIVTLTRNGDSLILSRRSP